MTKIVAFPPVGVVGHEWDIDYPVQESRDLFTGEESISATQPARRMVALNISALSKTRSGAGYISLLKAHLHGRMHCFRLSSYPINWHLDHARLKAVRSSNHLAWTNAGGPLTWQTDGQEFYWFNGTVVSGVVADGLLTVTGVPPLTLIARPGDFVRVFSLIPDTDGPLAWITAEARADEHGVAVLKLFDPLPDGAYARVNIGDSDSRVFRLSPSLPRAMQPVGANWTYSLTAREVLPHEITDPVEVNPW